MAVVIVEERRVGNDTVQGVRVYRSTRPIDRKSREQADELDSALSNCLASLTDEVHRAGWLDLKGRPGVVRLWWEVGVRLRSFVDDLDVGPPEDRQYLWRAMYDHAPGLAPGKMGSRADRPGANHFLYCYLLGAYEWETVDAFGDWTSWTEVFDSTRLRNDVRITDWLVQRSTSGEERWVAYVSSNRMGWYRPLAKAIRAKFKSRDSTGLSDEELFEELDQVFSGVSA